jgi:glucose-1-phosphate cytidylyltransferase
MLVVKPQQTFHVVDIGDDSRIAGFTHAAYIDVWINGGFFVLRQEIFEYLRPGEDLVMGGCVRADDAGRMLAIHHDGFWAPMDTLKVRTQLETLHKQGDAPWELWCSDGRTFT